VSKGVERQNYQYTTAYYFIEKHEIRGSGRGDSRSELPRESGKDDELNKERTRPGWEVFYNLVI
jgi:hypothetical protein